MKHNIYIALLLMFLPLAAKAQLGKELIPNGGFEEYAKTTPPSSEDESDEEDEDNKKTMDFDPYQKPLYWYFNSTLAYSRVKDAHQGMFAVKVYPNGGSFFSRDKDFNPYHIMADPGGEYRLSYWYKGTAKKPNIVVTVDWYKGSKSIKKDTRAAWNDKASNFSDTWQQKTLTFKAPAGADRAGVGLFFESDPESANTGGYILIDDVSFVQTKAVTPSAKLVPPSNIKAVPQQREIELSWNAVDEDGVSYQILQNEQVLATTKATSYIVEQLEPNTSYQFRIRTVKGPDASEPSAPVTRKTQQMSRGIDEEGRIPYLYTVREVGTCTRTLRLFYYDLANKDAQISYWVDGVAVTPADSSITFASKGEHLLRIEIAETPERKWDIEYKLIVD